MFNYIQGVERERLTQSAVAIVSSCHIGYTISITSHRLTYRKSSRAAVLILLMPRAVTRNLENELNNLRKLPLSLPSQNVCSLGFLIHKSHRERCWLALRNGSAPVRTNFRGLRAGSIYFEALGVVNMCFVNSTARNVIYRSPNGFQTVSHHHSATITVGPNQQVALDNNRRHPISIVREVDQLLLTTR
jgi:hypothetical protein